MQKWKMGLTAKERAEIGEPTRRERLQHMRKGRR
jgi:hypothetical protein